MTSGALPSQYSGTTQLHSKSGSAAETRRDKWGHTAATRRAAESNSPGPLTLLCASGRGGSGTSLIAALLAAAAAGDGYKVLLVDTDDLVGPQAISLGVTPVATWQDLRGGRAAPQDVTTPVSTTLTLIAGGPARRSAAQTTMLSTTERKACLRRLSGLAEGMDLVVFDCGSRLENILTALTPHPYEKLLAITSGADPIATAATYALCKSVLMKHGALEVGLLVNQLERGEANHCFETINAGMRQFLGSSLPFAGAIPADPTLDAAVRRGIPFLDAAVGSPAAVAAHDVVTHSMSIRTSSRIGA